MSPYPFIYYPTWGEFKDVLKSQYAVTIDNKIDPHSNEEFVFLKRAIGIDSVEYVLVVEFDDDERITVKIIYNICKNLNIDPSDFGLTLE